MQPEDVGQLLQKFSGVTLKSYGGLGGLKTFSFRSLGSQHTATVIDGFTILNTQSGQLNLGQVQTSNLESVTLGEQTSIIRTPVSSLVMANELHLRTFEGMEFPNSFKVRASSAIGSFGQVDNYVSVHHGKGKVGWTAFGKYRQAQGDYPFTLRVGNFDYVGKQRNNQLQELYSGFSFFIRPSLLKQPIRLLYRNMFIDQGLPGAVVLYNSSNQQYLNTENHSLSLDWEDNWGFTNVRYYAQYHYNEQRYLDSSYLNNQGFLENNFYQTNAHLGWRFLRSKFGDLLHFYGGLEHSFSFLHFQDAAVQHPERQITFVSAGLKINEKKYTFDMRLGHQLVLDRNDAPLSAVWRSLFSPLLQFETTEKGRFRWKYGGTTSTTSRMPSFNELYYAQVGNQHLKPEKVQQFVLSNGLSSVKSRIQWNNSMQLYFNRIEDKILSIPTKNLFIWSIQNIGVVHASGIDVNQFILTKINALWSLEWTINYSYQRSINRTEDDPNFGSQIAYIPEHSGNLDLTVRRKDTGIRISSSYVGTRYSLNENNAANRMEPIFILDASIFQKISFKKDAEAKNEHKWNLQLQVKNIMNQNYTYVRNFVMPGRNILFTISYAL